MHRERRNDNEQPAGWDECDRLVVRQMAGHLDYIAECGKSDDFAAFVCVELRRILGDEATLTDQQDAYQHRGEYDPGRELAHRILPVSHDVVDSVFSHLSHRRRLRIIRDLAKDEADRLRNGAKPKARAS